jgi:hypothetical protein
MLLVEERMGPMKRNLTKVFALGFAVSVLLAVMVYSQDLHQMLQQKAAALKQSAAQNQVSIDTPDENRAHQGREDTRLMRAARGMACTEHSSSAGEETWA